MVLNISSLPAVKFRYRPVVKMGPFIKTAGMVGISPETGELAGGGVAAEFDQIMQNLLGFMRDNALSNDELFSVTLFTTRFDSFADVNRVWDTYFPADLPLPARTSVGVSQLPIGALIEAEFCFYQAVN